MKVLDLSKKYRIGFEKGFALPSVLLPVIILTLASASIISTQYLRRRVSARAIAEVKADYAAQSGRAKVISFLDAQRKFSSDSTGWIDDYTSLMEALPASAGLSVPYCGLKSPWSTLAGVPKDFFQMRKYGKKLHVPRNMCGRGELSQNRLLTQNSSHQWSPR